jgi:hypothetical protein
MHALSLFSLSGAELIYRPSMQRSNNPQAFSRLFDAAANGFTLIAGCNFASSV